MIDSTNINIDGHVKIWDPNTKEVFVSQHNDINPETMTLIIANMLAGNNSQYVYEMQFGNGGIIIDETGNITYNNVAENLIAGAEASLYNPTYSKVIDEVSSYNDNGVQNKITVTHTNGLTYTDLVVTCTLEEAEPYALSNPNNLVSTGQNPFDNASSYNGEFIFNELGLKSKGTNGRNSGYLLSHIVFHPVQKSANRVIQIIYTLRIRVN